jgi:hypothetical protein
MVVMDGLGLYWIINWQPCTLVVAPKVVQTRQVMQMFLSNFTGSFSTFYPGNVPLLGLCSQYLPMSSIRCLHTNFTGSFSTNRSKLI